MAGIWDRLVGNAPSGDGVPVHRVTGAVYFKAEAVGTNQQLLGWVSTGLMTPLSTAAEQDLLNLAAGYAALLTDGAKALYLHKLESLMLAVEDGVPAVTETKFRNLLGI